LKEINTITILGANGNMGAKSAAIVASFGEAKVFMLARTNEKASEGITAAIESIRSDTIKKRMIPGTYEKDLKTAVEESQWVFELLAEEYAVKEPMIKEVGKYRKPGTIVSTVSSGLSIARLASNLDTDGQKHYFGTHFFNPPYKMILCELVSHEKSDLKVKKALGKYLSGILRRAVVYTNDTPGFAGNRIGFQLLNEIAQYAEKYTDRGGIALMDEIMGGFVGRAVGPLATIDFVGLDVHKAVVDNIYNMTNDSAHETFKLPGYIQSLVDSGKLGDKSGEGLFKNSKTENGKEEKCVFNILTGNYDPRPVFDIAFTKAAMARIRESDYTGAMNVIKEAKGFEAEICRYMIARYIGYSLSIVGEVIENKEMADMAMGFGFNWMPPSAYVDFLGGVEAAKFFIDKAGIDIPPILEKAKPGKYYLLQDILDARSLYKGK